MVSTEITAEIKNLINLELILNSAKNTKMQNSARCSNFWQKNQVSSAESPYVYFIDHTNNFHVFIQHHLKI